MAPGVARGAFCRKLVILGTSVIIPLGAPLVFVVSGPVPRQVQVAAQMVISGVQNIPRTAGPPNPNMVLLLHFVVF